MGELSPEGEAEWRRLSRQIELAEGFWLGFVFSDADVRQELLNRVARTMRDAGRELALICPRDEGELLGVLSQLFAEETRKAGCVWMDLDLGGGGSPRRREALEWLVLRMNERREAIRRWLGGGLIIGATDALAPLLRDAASDLWSARALVVDHVELPEEESRTRSLEDAELSGIQRSPVIAPLVEVARLDRPALIVGGHLAGKRQAARLIHRSSKRRGGTCVVVDSVSLTLPAVLGHERGAFLGALRPQKGVVELADGGTLVLHQIGGLPLDVQEAIVQVIDKHEVTRLGATRATPVDVRILATTSRDLDEMCREGFFRQDLLHRLSLTRVELPAEAGPASDPH